MKRIIFVLVVMLVPIMLFAQTQRWVYRYSAPGNPGYDSAYAIAYGDDGNIYIAGRSVNSAGNPDFTVISLTPTGTERWVYRYISPNYWEGAYLITYGPDGNIYAVGTINNDSTILDNCDIAVVSLTPTGTLRWIYYYDGTYHGEDFPYSVVCGRDSNIYVCGYCTNSSPLWEDFTVLSLTPAGTQRWVYTYDGVGPGLDHARSLVYGLDGNIYIAGTTSSSASNYNDFTVMKFSSSGTQRWMYKYDWPNAPDVAYAITYGTDNYIYAAGEIYGGSGYSYDFTVIKIDTSGTQQWVYRYAGTVNDWDEARAIIYGSDNNIYAAGTTWNTGTGNDITVISVNQAGNENWVYKLSNSTGWDYAWSLARIQNGNIYVAGDDGNFTTVNLTSVGSPRWVHIYNGPASGGARSLVFGDDGNLYIAGYGEGTTNCDIVVISLDTVTAGIQELSSIRATQPSFRISLGTFQNHNLSYTLSTPEPTTLKLSLYNISGEKIISWQNSFRKGNSHDTKAIPQIGPGVYFLSAETERGYKENKKIIVF